MMRAKIKVDGMSCGHCVMRVKSALMRDGVVNAEVSLESGLAIVEFDEKKVSLDELIEGIKKVGYEARLLEKEEL